VFSSCWQTFVRGVFVRTCIALLGVALVLCSRGEDFGLSRIVALLILLLHSRIKALLILLLHPWIKALVFHPWIVARCVPHSLQSTLSCMCICHAHRKTCQTSRGMLTEIVRARCHHFVWIRLRVTQVSAPDSAFCVSMRRCFLSRRRGLAVALEGNLLPLALFVGIPSRGS